MRQIAWMLMKVRFGPLTSVSINERSHNRFWRTVLLLSVLAYISFAALFVIGGTVNADEGWYLYASRLVFDGAVPYRDFAYTQTPLLPYVYGLPQQLFSQGLYAGRLTSMAISLLTVGLSVHVARRYRGQPAAAITALLFATFTWGIYFNTIVKTYALTGLCFTLTLYFLSSYPSLERRYPFAIASAIAATMVRLSSAAFLVTIVTLVWLTTPHRVARTVPLGALLAIGIVGYFLLPHRDVIWWNLLAYHVGQWGDVAFSERVWLSVLKVVTLVLEFGLYMFLGVVLIVSVLRHQTVRDYVSRHRPLLIYSLGVLGFMAAHLLTGDWHTEYMTPAIVAFFPVVAVIACEVWKSPDTNRFYSTLLAISLVLTIVLGIPKGLRGLKIWDTPLPVQEIQHVADFVSAHSKPDDRLLALEGLWVPLEADRLVLDGLSIAQFSYVNTDTSSAERLKVVNSELLVDHILSRRAKAIILTDHDWRLFERTSSDEAVRDALQRHYFLALTQPDFGQRSESVYVYLRSERDLP